MKERTDERTNEWITDWLNETWITDWLTDWLNDWATSSLSDLSEAPLLSATPSLSLTASQLLLIWSFCNPIFLFATPRRANVAGTMLNNYLRAAVTMRLATSSCAPKLQEFPACCCANAFCHSQLQISITGASHQINQNSRSVNSVDFSAYSEHMAILFTMSLLKIQNCCWTT